MAAENDLQDSDDAQDERDTAVLKSHIARLMEHFDSVQIFVTRHENATGRTCGKRRGDGNWYARFGTVREWVTQQEEQMRMDQRGDGG
jgi:hypothetical protein